MGELEEAAEKLREEVETAFAETPYPGDDALVESKRPEALEIARDFKGTDWRDWLRRPVGDLRRQSSALSYFTPEAFRYYLPAFLLAGLRDYSEADLIPESIVFHLGSDSRSYLTGLSSKEKKSLRDYLKFLLAHHGEDFAEKEIRPALKALEAS